VGGCVSGDGSSWLDQAGVQTCVLSVDIYFLHLMKGLLCCEQELLKHASAATAALAVVEHA
jgi:hypothetical protein